MPVMIKPGLPADEKQRLAALHSLHILDTPAEDSYDRLTRIAQGLFAVPMAAIGFVDQERVWLKSRQGLGMRQMPRESSFAAHAILDSKLFVVLDALADSRFRDNPLVTGEPKIRFYAACVLKDAGRAKVGLLAIMDARPRKHGETDLNLLRELGGVVEEQIRADAVRKAHEEWLRTQEELDRKKKRDEAAQDPSLEQRQTQKMEAIGQLAGGVAHDFNNFLTIILSYSELMLDDAKTRPQDREKIQEIHNAAYSAGVLTRKLLAFGRKQVRQPGVHSVNFIVSGMEKMLQRLIGESITLSSDLSPKTGYANIDRSQLEQILLNLVVNARDAMPTGGRIIVKSEPVELAQPRGEIKPGSYIALSVTDTGCGMDKATQERIFEPFFTTKERGKGTGLGLATVYSIIKQSSGHVELASAPGKGTSFKIYLPRVAREPAPVSAPSSSQQAAGGRETILVVEDEKIVRDIAETALKSKGYTVLSAASAAEAKRLYAEAGGAVSLLLTDIVMPEENGHELAQALRARRPGLKVLYMSGYTQNIIAKHGVTEPDVHLLQKPFTPSILAQKVREILDETTAKSS